MATTKYFIVSVLILFWKVEATAEDFGYIGQSFDGEGLSCEGIKIKYFGRLCNSRIDLNELAQMGLKPIKPLSIKGLKTPIKIYGKPSVTDGDTIKFGKTRVRLYGIDAPEIGQKCTLARKAWQCGMEARRALEVMIGKKNVFCETKDVDRYGRIIAICRINEVELNATMVLEGWALAYRRYSNDYLEEENAAKSDKLGIWRGSFKTPWSWRQSNRNNRKD